jgi:SAM-dependent methyltransferase
LPLRELIQAGVNPPLQSDAGTVKRTTRQVLLQMGRPNAVHQQRVDLELLHRLEEVEHRQRELSEWLLITSNRGDETGGRAIELEGALGRLADRSSELEHRLAEFLPGNGPLYGDGAFQLERFDAGLGGTVVGFRQRGDTEGSERSERLYLHFEDYFRGSEEEIRERQRAYLPLLAGRDRILDVGCGRGEFLELMRELGVRAEGVDLDPGMVEHCRGKGLENVQVGDASGYLESLEDHSLGMVFAAQLIEHLPYAELVRFLRAARDKLGPGGVLVVETVNPHAAQALKNFWIDPTHRHPLFPETVIALCGLTGFAEAYVWYPQGTGDPDRDRIQQPDYAVIAQAPDNDTPAPRPDAGK